MRRRGRRRPPALDVDGRRRAPRPVSAAPPLEHQADYDVDGFASFIDAGDAAVLDSFVSGVQKEFDDHAAVSSAAADFRRRGCERARSSRRPREVARRTRPQYSSDRSRAAIVSATPPSPPPTPAPPARRTFRTRSAAAAGALAAFLAAVAARLQPARRRRLPRPRARGLPRRRPSLRLRRALVGRGAHAAAARADARGVAAGDARGGAEGGVRARGAPTRSTCSPSRCKDRAVSRRFAQQRERRRLRGDRTSALPRRVRVVFCSVSLEAYSRLRPRLLVAARLLPLDVA